MVARVPDASTYLGLSSRGAATAGSETVAQDAVEATLRRADTLASTFGRPAPRGFTVTLLRDGELMLSVSFGPTEARSGAVLPILLGGLAPRSDGGEMRDAMLSTARRAIVSGRRLGWIATDPSGSVVTFEVDASTDAAERAA